MTRIIVKELIWDEWSEFRIRKHDVSAEEITKAGKKLIYHRRTYSNRYLLVGRSDKRLVTLIVSRKGLGRYYLVTARDADKRERKVVYEKEKQNTKV